jgi:hypothetical protein
MANPFHDATGLPADPRAIALQEERDRMAAGRAAATSIAPNYEQLKRLTKRMVACGCSADMVADAVEFPHVYWPKYFTPEEG